MPGYRADRPQHVGAGRDGYVAGRDQTFNTYAGCGIPDTGTRLRAAADDLAVAVRKQWRAEEGRRRLQDPVPLPVRWTVAGPPLSDSAENIFLSAGEVTGLDGTLGEEVDVFARIPSRRLVVIGQPGAGKTVFTIRFTLGLLARRQPGDPVPVIFGLHTWNPLEQDLQDWLATRLAEDYPALGNADESGGTIAAALVRNDLIFPVLDGLDEIGEFLRGQTLRTLNACLSGGTPVIVTCREKDYGQLVAGPLKLTSAAVIRLLPLGIGDLASYLPRTSKECPSQAPPGLSTKWDPVLRRLAGHPGDPACQALLDVLGTPLMTSLARSVYSDTPADPARLLDGGFAGREEIEAHLLDEFIPAAFTTIPASASRRRGGPHPEDAERWLGFLARHLDRLGTRDLQWWRLPDALPVPARWLAPGLFIVTGSAILAYVWHPLYFGGAYVWQPLVLGYGASVAAGIMAGLSIITVRLPPPEQRKASDRLRVMTRRLNYVSLAALFMGFALAFTFTQDPGELFGSGFRQVADQDSLYLLLGLAVGVILGAAGIDAQQAPTTTPLRLRRRLRLLSRRLLRDAGYGLLTGIIVSLALWIAWCAGFTAATEVRVATAPAFPGEGTTHRLHGGTVYTDYPGGIRLTIAADGDRYAQQRTPSDTGGFAGTIHDQFVIGRWSRPAPSICKHAGGCGGTYIYQAANGGLIRIYPDPDGINESELDFEGNYFSGSTVTYNSPLPFPTLIAWAYHLDLREALSEEVEGSGLAALIVGLLSSLIGAVFLWLGFPADTTQAISPLSTLRTDRNAAIFRVGVISLLITAALLFVAFLEAILGHGDVFSDWIRPVSTEVMPGLAVGLLALTLSTWARLQVAKTWLAARGKLPWRLMRFLEDAHACGALRQAGASYQFRHVRLQERLAARTRPSR